MKRSTLLLLLGLGLCAWPSCKPAQPESSKANDASGVNAPVNAISAAETVKVSEPKVNQSPKPLRTVTGFVTQTRSYCGGAAPSEAILQRYRMPLAVSGMTLHLRQGNTNNLGLKVVTSSVTDAEGRFSFQVPDGEYCLINDERLQMPDPTQFSKNANLNYNEACHAEWIRKCDVSFVVSGADLTLDTLRTHARCFVGYLSPCIQYRGPLPP